MQTEPRNKLPLLVAAIAVIVVLAAVAFHNLRGTRPPVEVAAVRATPTPAPKSATTDGAAAKHPKTSATPAAPAPSPTTAASTAGKGATAGDAGKPATGTPGEPEMIGGDPFDDWDTTEKAITDAGGIAALWDKLDEVGRSQLFSALVMADKVNDYLPGLMDAMKTTDERAFLFAMVQPKGYWDSETEGAPAGGDQALRKLLDAPAGEMGKAEILSRMQLASEMDDPEYSRQWADRALAMNPKDPNVALAANAQRLAAGGQGAKLTDGERENSAQALEKVLREADYKELQQPKRVAAYYTVFQFKDKSRAKSLLTDARAKETDPDAQKALDGLLSNLDKSTAAKP